MDSKPARWLFAAGALLFLTWALACNGAGDDGADGAATDLTVEDVYARFAEGIERPEQIYHAVVEVSQDAGPFSYEGTFEYWVDAERNLARQDREVVGDGGTRRILDIIAGGARYTSAEDGQPASKREASTCHGASAAVASVLGCLGPTEESTKSVETGRYEGREAMVIVTVGTSHGEDESFTFTDRQYLDAETFLPIALESEGTFDYGEVYPTHGLFRYDNEFVSADSLPDDFFDPALTGYVKRNPEDGLDGADPGVTVYWLGRDFEGADGTPPLTLAIAYVQPRELPGYRLSLEYKLAEEEFGTPAVALEEWDRGEWEEFLEGSSGNNWWDWPCREKEEMTVNGRRVVIHKGFEDETMGRPETLPEGPEDVVCPDAAYDRFIAHVYLDDALVQIEGPEVCDSVGCEDSPYDTVEGIEAIASALQPRP